MNNYIKKILLVITAISLTSWPIFAQKQNRTDEIQPKSFSYRLHYYGYCNGSQITEVFDGYVNLPSRLSRTEKKLTNIYYDHTFGELSTPYVIFRYFDSNGNMITPLSDNVYEFGNLSSDYGSFGSCPGTSWE